MNKGTVKMLLGGEIVVGNWKYIQENETILHVSGGHPSEIDLERSSLLDHVWQMHTMRKNELHDLYICLKEVKEFNPNLPIFTNKPSKLFIENDEHYMNAISHYSLFLSLVDYK